MKEGQYDNITVKELLDNLEYIILSNPEMDGVELEDSEGRVWFITKTSEDTASIN